MTERIFLIFPPSHHTNGFVPLAIAGQADYKYLVFFVLFSVLYPLTNNLFQSLKLWKR